MQSLLVESIESLLSQFSGGGLGAKPKVLGAPATQRATERPERVDGPARLAMVECSQVLWWQLRGDWLRWWERCALVTIGRCALERICEGALTLRVEPIGSPVVEAIARLVESSKEERGHTLDAA